MRYLIDSNQSEASGLSFDVMPKACDPLAELDQARAAKRSMARVGP
jgi:hypothetical protein